MADANSAQQMERPSDEVVDKIYVEVLEQLALPAAAAQKLIANETIEKKWQMIQMNASLLSNETMQAIRSWNSADADFLKQFDSSDSPDLDSIRSLKSRVSTANKDWLQGFLHAGGVSAILRAMRKRVSHFPRSDLDHGVLMELCETLKASMNTADGLEHVAETEGSIEMLALCLDFQCPPLARLVLEILAVTCYFNKSDLVKNGLEVLHRRAGVAPYSLLTDALTSTDVAVKSSTMIFINSFITSTQNLDDRMAIRNYLLSQDITGICESIIETFDAEKEAEAYQEMVDEPTAPTGGAGSHVSMAHLGPIGTHTSFNMAGRTGAFGSTSRHSMDRGSSLSRLSHNMGEGLARAEDGKTPIFPDRGIMAGKGITAKNKNRQAKQLVSSLLNISRTKMRWYVLDGKTLSWTKFGGSKEEESDPADQDAANDSISMSKVIDVRPHSSDQDLVKLPYSFDIITETRTFSIAVDSEDLRLKWLAALKYAKEKTRSAAGPSMTKLRSTDILDVRVVRVKFDMFRKQCAIFQAVMAADLEATVKELLGNLNAADPLAVFTFLRDELNHAGLGDQLLKLLHQLLLLPTDLTLGRDTWEALQRVVFELRNFDRARKHSSIAGGNGWLAPIEEFQTLLLSRRELDARIKRARAAEAGGSSGEAQSSRDQEVIKALEAEVHDLRSRLNVAATRRLGESHAMPAITGLPPVMPLSPMPYHGTSPLHPLMDASLSASNAGAIYDPARDGPAEGAAVTSSLAQQQQLLGATGTLPGMSATARATVAQPLSATLGSRTGVLQSPAEATQPLSSTTRSPGLTQPLSASLRKTGVLSDPKTATQVLSSTATLPSTVSHSTTGELPPSADAPPSMGTLRGPSLMDATVARDLPVIMESDSPRSPATNADEAMATPGSRPSHPLAAMLAAKRAAQEQGSGDGMAGPPSEAPPLPPRPPAHPLAAMLAAKKAAVSGGEEAVSSPPSEAPPRPPAHPLAAMLAAKKAAQDGGDTVASPSPSDAPARPPMHPLAMALKSKQAGGEAAHAEAASEEDAPPARPMHPLAMALAGGGGAGGRPAHPLAMALKGKGPGGPLPGAPKADGAAGPKSAEALGLPPKPKVEPPHKMKGLFWSPIPPVKVQSTVWGHLKDFKEFDVKALLDDFAAKTETAAKPATKSDAPKVVTLFDGKRNQNVLIALGRFKKSPEQLREAVLSLQEAFLNGENTQKLLNILPTSEEVNTLHGYDGDVTSLGPVENFFHAISAVPRVEQRLKCWMTTLSFDDGMQALRDKMALVAKGTVAVKDCKGFLKILELTLAVGNTMNGTSVRGGAYGFRLDVLSKLNDVKAGSRLRGTLLNFIAAQADAKIPECRNLVKELAPVTEAAEHSLGQMENDLKAMALSLNLCKKEIEEMEAAGDEAASGPFKAKMGRFLSRVDKPWAELQASLETTKAQLNDVMASFGEELGKTSDTDPAQKFFTLISTFASGYHNALEANRKAAAEAAKLAAKQGGAEDAKAAAAKGKAAEQQNIFNSFSTAQAQKSADEIVAEFRDKMKARRVKVSNNLTGTLNDQDWG